MPRFPRASIKISPVLSPLRVAALGILLLLHALQSTPAEADRPASPAPRLMATYYPLYIIALNVTQGTGAPQPGLLLEPTGGCAHGLSLRPAQVSALRGATAIFETGLGLEPFLDDERYQPEGGYVRIPAARDIPETDLMKLAEAHEHEESHHEAHEAHGAPAHEGFNGHAWSSPRLAARMARTLGEALAGLDPERAPQYRRNAAAYAARLSDLDAELHRAAAPLRGRRVALSHTSLAYLARELGLEVAAVLRDEDEREPGPRELARVIDALRADGVEAVLCDPQDEGRLSGLVARETGGVILIELDPAASGPLEAGAYESIMRANAERLGRWAARAAGPAVAQGAPAP